MSYKYGDPEKNKCPFITELIEIIYPGSDDPSNKEFNFDSICIVMEFIDTDLDQILKHKLEFKEHHMLKIAYTALSSLCFIHEANVVHRDLKSANLLVSADCNAKICDFGLSRSIPKCQVEMNNLLVDNEGINHLDLRKRVSAANDNGKEFWTA